MAVGGCEVQKCSLISLNGHNQDLRAYGRHYLVLSRNHLVVIIKT